MTRELEVMSKWLSHPCCVCSSLALAHFVIQDWLSASQEVKAIRAVRTSTERR